MLLLLNIIVESEIQCVCCTSPNYHAYKIPLHCGGLFCLFSEHEKNTCLPLYMAQCVVVSIQISSRKSQISTDHCQISIQNSHISGKNRQISAKICEILCKNYPTSSKISQIFS